MMKDRLDIFCVTHPGLEDVLDTELDTLGFTTRDTTHGGIAVSGSWEDVWRANLSLRTASRVLVRMDTFPAHHLAQLDKKATRLDWSHWLRADTPVRVDATSRSSRIYHEGAAAERVGKAIQAALGCPVSADAPVRVLVRIEKDICTISLDTSGELLHRRGHKQEVNKAPMRETLAAAFLALSGYTGSETVIDPMCGSGTFAIEAAEISQGLTAGRSRRFAFEHLPDFDPARCTTLRSTPLHGARNIQHFASDRDAGAVRIAQSYARHSGVEDKVCVEQCDIVDRIVPDTAPGLVILNPPYGARVGNPRQLTQLYRSLGQTLWSRFSGWRVGLVTSDAKLAKATGLPLRPVTPSIDHGGIKIRLYTCPALR